MNMYYLYLGTKQTVTICFCSIVERVLNFMTKCQRTHKTALT